MLNNQMNFDFSLMKKLLDVAHGKLIDMLGRHGILDQYLWMSVMPQDDHLCSKSAQKRQLLLGTVPTELLVTAKVKVIRLTGSQGKCPCLFLTYYPLSIYQNFGGIKEFCLSVTIGSLSPVIRSVTIPALEIVKGVATAQDVS